MSPESSSLPDAAAPLPLPDRVMAVGAHPDDAEFGAGATLSQWGRDGSDVFIVVATDGSKGSWDPTVDPVALAARRRIEQQSAAEILGASVAGWLDQVDGELQHTPELRRELARLVRVHRPDVVVTHDPWQRYQLHPDHRAIGLLTLDAVVAAREPHFYPDLGLAAHRPSTILLWDSDQPDHAEPVEDRGFAAKIDALLAHESQSTSTMGDAARSPARRAEFVGHVEDGLATAGAGFGFDRAEVFKRLTP